MAILTINAGPQNFESTLPDGVVGDTDLVSKITVDNIDRIEINEESDYEENMDGEYRIYLKDGNEIHFDGYSGLWELASYDRMPHKKELLKDLRDFLEYHIDFC